MSFHLDTNVAIGLQAGRPPHYRGRYEALTAAREEIFVSSVVAFELWYGVAKSERYAPNARALHLFLDTLTGILAFSAEDAQAAGELRRTLEAVGTPIGAYDLLIAAQAVRLGATLVTANRREFARVPGLKLEDWTR